PRPVGRQPPLPLRAVQPLEIGGVRRIRQVRHGGREVVHARTIREQRRSCPARRDEVANGRGGRIRFLASPHIETGATTMRALPATLFHLSLRQAGQSVQSGTDSSRRGRSPMDLAPYRAHRRILTASLVGTAVEFYDFYIYGTAAALVFGPLFFPSESESAQLMLSFMSFGLAFFARPVGAVVFGHFGDRIGRKSTLVASLMLMGTSTLLIAFLPTYAMAGWIAPLLLCTLRFGQGFGLGGEWGGAALLAVENAPPGWRARFGMAPQLGAPVGFLAANGLFLLLGLWLSDAEFAAWGWRIPFLVSAVLVGLGLWVRLKIHETPAFAEALKREPPVGVPLGAVLREHGVALLAGTFAVVACFAI